jgi:hypothetical protein
VSSTIFVRQLLHQPKGATIARVVTQCHEVENRLWVRAMEGQHPLCKPTSIESIWQLETRLLVIAPTVQGLERPQPLRLPQKCQVHTIHIQ